MKKRKYTSIVNDEQNEYFRPEYVIYFSGFLDLFGVSMILPLIIPRAREMGASPTLAGVLGSVYGGFQLFSGPVIGNWSDSIERKTSLAVVLFLSAMGYGILGFATSIIFLFLARLPLGIFKHSQGLSKSYLADLVPTSERNKVLGYFNAFSNIGFFLGPLIGGHIAEWPEGFNTVGYLSAFIFFLNSAIIWFVLPSVKSLSHPEMVREDSVTSFKKITSDEISFSPSMLIESFQKVDWKDMWDWFLIKFLLGFSVIIFRSNFSVMVRESYDAGAKINGYLISFSAFSATVCGMFVGKISNIYKNDYRLTKHMSVLLTAVLFCLMLCPNIWYLAFFLPFLSLSTSVMRVSTVSLTIERSKNHGTGALMGLQQSIMAIARMLSAFIGGVALEFTNTGPAILSVIFSAIGLSLLILRPQDVASRKKKDL